MHTLDSFFKKFPNRFVWRAPANEAVRHYANIPRLYPLIDQFFVCLISFILDRKRSIAFSVRQSSSPSPPNPYLKTLHTDYLYYYNLDIPDGRLVIVGAQRVQERSSRSRVRITLQELFLIWLGGRITSPRVWFGAGEQGVTLKLAWGPSNSSPWNLLFVFAVFVFFSYYYCHLYLLFPFFSGQFSL